jgi:predicted ABC-type ATPase
MGLIKIVRGLPGSGKSSLARRMAMNDSILVVEPDAFIMDLGVYKYSEERFSAANKMARNIVAEAGKIGCDCIFTDVLPTLEEVKQIAWDNYCSLSSHNYFEVIDMPKITVEESLHRNTHGVIFDDILKMAAKWEDFDNSAMFKMVPFSCWFKTAPV